MSRAGRSEIFGRTVLGLLFCLALSVRAQSPKDTTGQPRSFRNDLSDNVFQAAPNLPAGLRRVAVLPIAWEGAQSDLSEGCEMFTPILSAELVNSRKFEVISVMPEDLRRRTGRLSWTGAEILPADFLDSMQRVYGCDAVLFCQLSTFRAYAPLAVGWRMKLVDVRTGQILWAVDNVFDAEDGVTLNEARRENSGGPWFLRDQSGDWKLANSPRQFGRFALCQTLSTLPKRQKMVKVLASTVDVPDRR
jgi:hypothetical protein